MPKAIANRDERIRFLETFAKRFPTARVNCLCADRAFDMVWLFQSGGFCMAATHFTEVERLSKLFALLTLAFCWAMRTGLGWQQWQPIELKKHGRRAKRLWHLGLDYLRHLVRNPSASNESDFVQSLQLLSCTYVLLA